MYSVLTDIFPDEPTLPIAYLISITVTVISQGIHNLNPSLSDAIYNTVIYGISQYSTVITLP